MTTEEKGRFVILRPSGIVAKLICAHENPESATVELPSGVKITILLENMDHVGEEAKPHAQVIWDSQTLASYPVGREPIHVAGVESSQTAYGARTDQSPLCEMSVATWGGNAVLERM